MGQLMTGGRPPLPTLEELPSPGFPGLPAYEALLQRCWAQDPTERPGFAEVIQKLRWASVPALPMAHVFCGLAKGRAVAATKSWKQ